MEETETLEFENIMAMLEEYADKARSLYEQNLEKDGRKATGRLIQSVQTTITYGNLVYTVVLKAADYMQFVENGRKAGKMPPRSAILQWIEKKPILPRPLANGKLPTNEQLAFLIQRAIGEKGTIKDMGYGGTHILGDTIEALNQEYLPKLQEALNRDWEAYSIKIYRDIGKMIRV